MAKFQQQILVWKQDPSQRNPGVAFSSQFEHVERSPACVPSASQRWLQNTTHCQFSHPLKEPHWLSGTFSSTGATAKTRSWPYASKGLHIFFALEGQGHYNSCTRNKPKCFKPQTNKITPMLHRKWIIWDLAAAIFFHQIRNNDFLLEAMASHCTNLEGSSYHLVLKYEKLFSGNCTQFSSQLLNCLRWRTPVSLKKAPCSSYSFILTAAGGWAPPFWGGWKRGQGHGGKASPDSSRL